ncbi:hypothetical protein ACX80E_04835 [Arthrobacter sp. TMN-49]
MVAHFHEVIAAAALLALIRDQRQQRGIDKASPPAIAEVSGVTVD